MEQRDRVYLETQVKLTIKIRTRLLLKLVSRKALAEKVDYIQHCVYFMYTKAHIYINL